MRSLLLAQPLYFRETVPVTHWMGGWEGSLACLGLAVFPLSAMEQSSSLLTVYRLAVPTPLLYEIQIRFLLQFPEMFSNFRRG
jgi:hypothetical protein